MVFANKEAENLFLEYNKELGLQHINCDLPITVEDIEYLKELLEEIDD